MEPWGTESFEEIFNRGRFAVTQLGPLRGPVTSASIKRSPSGDLILETTSAGDSKSSRPEDLPGTIRSSEYVVECETPGYGVAILRGVERLNEVTSHHRRTRTETTTETSSVGSLEISLVTAKTGHYLVEWIDNLPKWIWPQSITSTGVDEEGIEISGIGESLRIHRSFRYNSSASHALNLKIDEMDIFVCIAGKRSEESRHHHGYIVYRGIPDEDRRNRVRDCISFCLNRYLVHLGHTTFSSDWEPIGLKATSAFSIDLQVYDLVSLPPAPISGAYPIMLDQQKVSRLVAALFKNYDSLGFRAFSWAYWHALCAPTHIAAAHFGAIIEALQRAYLKGHPEISTTMLDNVQWKTFSKGIRVLIESMAVDSEIAKLLKNKAGGLNQAPQGIVLRRMLDALGLAISDREIKAWKERNQAAHGMQVDYPDLINVIQNNKLLKILCHRIILRMSGASDEYIDYYNFNFAARKTADGVP